MNSLFAMYGRPSLALDILEIFRHIFIDRLMIRLFNLAILNEKDFEPAPKGGIYLSDSGQKKFFKQYEKMTGEYTGDTERTAGPAKFRQCFQECVNSVRRCIANDTEFTVPDCLKKE